MSDHAQELEDRWQRDADEADYFETFGITPQQARENEMELSQDQQRDENL